MIDHVEWCDSCGRRIERSEESQQSGNEVRYCSTSCRRRGVDEVDRALEAQILDLLAQREAGKTICPSEAARAVSRDADQANEEPGSRRGTERGDSPEQGWRDLMEPARSAARRLAAAGEVEVTQHGRVVDPSTAKGPIRLRRMR